MAGGDSGRAIGHLIAAARSAAATLASTRAIELYRTALENMSDAPSPGDGLEAQTLRCRVLIELADTLSREGAQVEAAKLRSQAREVAEAIGLEIGLDLP